MTRAAFQMATATRRSALTLSGLAVVAVLSATVANLSGAVLAPAIVATENSLRRVQHSTGGIVGELKVTEGQTVRQGDLLLRLDGTVPRANLGIITGEMRSLSARKLRLEAELRGEATLPAAADQAVPGSQDASSTELLASEQRLLAARLALREGQAAQLTQRIAQLEDEVKGAEAQVDAMRRQRRIADLERTDLEELLRRQLIQRQRVTQLQRETARLDGTLGELTARIAQVRGKISETRLQILQIDSTHFSEVTRELRDTETRLAELAERRVAAEDQLARIDVRAPIDGQVHQLAARTVGGVIAPGETAMLIVPDKERLIVEARVSPSDIDEVRQQQTARLRFTTLNQGVTPEIEGIVMRISGDLSRDPAGGAPYYLVAIEVPEKGLASLGSIRLLPGMPAEAMMATGSRSLASYLLKPLRDHFQRALRES